MFLVATRDRLINNKYIRTVFHEYLPKVEILEIDSGHCPQNEMSHEFNEILSNFSKNILKNDRDLNNIIKDHKHESRHYE